MPRCAATARALTTVTADDSIGRSTPATTALASSSERALTQRPVVADADAVRPAGRQLREQRAQPIGERHERPQRRELLGRGRPGS